MKTMHNYYHSKLHKWGLLGTDVMFCHTCGYQLNNNANLFSSCGCRQRNYDLFESSDSKEGIIGKYFKHGYNYQKICLFLEKFHGIKLFIFAKVSWNYSQFKKTWKTLIIKYAGKSNHWHIVWNVMFNNWAGS